MDKQNNEQQILDDITVLQNVQKSDMGAHDHQLDLGVITDKEDVFGYDSIHTGSRHIFEAIIENLYREGKITIEEIKIIQDNYEITNINIENINTVIEDIRSESKNNLENKKINLNVDANEINLDQITNSPTIPLNTNQKIGLDIHRNEYLPEHTSPTPVPTINVSLPKDTGKILHTDDQVLENNVQEPPINPPRQEVSRVSSFERFVESVENPEILESSYETVEKSTQNDLQNKQEIINTVTTTTNTYVTETNMYEYQKETIEIFYTDGSSEIITLDPVLINTDITYSDREEINESNEITYQYPSMDTSTNITTEIVRGTESYVTTYEDREIEIQNDDGTHTTKIVREYTNEFTTPITTIETSVGSTSYTYSDGYVQIEYSDPIVTESITYDSRIEKNEEIVDSDTTPYSEDDSFVLNEDTVYEFTLTDILSNDYDLDGDNLELVSFNQPENGVLEYNYNTEVFKFTPDENWNGETIFNYTLTDGTTETSSSVVLNVNDVPEIPDDTGGSNSGHGNGSNSGHENSNSGHEHGNGHNSGQDNLFVFGFDSNDGPANGWVNNGGNTSEDECSNVQINVDFEDNYDHSSFNW